MPAVWPAFQSQLVSYLKSNKAKSEDETAKKIGQLYHQAVKTAMPILVPGATPIGGRASIIANGFKASFKLGKALGKYFIETYWSYPNAIFFPHNEFVVLRNDI